MYLKTIAIGFTLLIATCQSDEPKKGNRLAKESSPYLLQHAHNPVDWYPWGEEALERAKKENKIIFLSVGYAACHWCHVMERESFEDQEIAKFLNETFVCIKVDREERPDIDQIYMTAVQMMTGRGGWPMSVFMTPDTKPIFGGTYFPARDGDRGAATGFLSVIKRVDVLWKTESDGLKAQADRVTKALQSSMASSETIAKENALNRKELYDSIQETANELVSGFDAVYGGFGFVPSKPDRPKFPEPANLLFFLERSNRTTIVKEERDDAMRMLRKTLDSMMAGGIYDHLGGGFHRYSVDRFWKIPHFEKMLYDNGQLAQLYALAFEATGQVEYRTIAEGTCDFVIRELTAPGGPFYSSLDADSEGEEGKFYRWEKSELNALSKSIPGYAGFAKVYGFDLPPNFEEKYFAPQSGRTLTQIAEENKQTLETLLASLAEPRKELFVIRSKRIRPPTDVKVLTSWNGLMIAGLADAGRILKRPDYIQAATNAADFLLKELKTKEGRLLRTHAAGESKLKGYLDDYAFLVHGLLRLHHATKEGRFLEQAIALTKTEMEFFQDENTGGFFYTAVDHPELIVRFHDPTDGVIPSGNSITASNLIYLTYTAKRSEFEAPLQRLLQSSVPLIEKNPRACALMSAQIANWLDRNP